MSVPSWYDRPRPLAYVYDEAYRGPPPNWDIGRPQAAFVRLAEAGGIRGPVLDVGCGTGELSMYLARRGHRVLGIDLSPKAVEIAREKAYWRRIDADFLVWDALALSGLAGRGFSFRTVVDCACYHVLHPSERDVYVASLETVVPEGGVYYVLGDVRQEARRSYGISPAELRARFESGDEWRVEFVVDATFERRYSRNPAYLAGIVRR